MHVHLTGDNQMGFTHYWSHNGIKDEQWADVCRFAADAIELRKDIIRDGSGQPDSVAYVGEDSVHFNGAEEEAHEDFFLSKEAQSQFCKTERKPYDVVVVAVLLFCYAHVDNFGLSSDGDIFGEKPTDPHNEHTDALNLLYSIVDIPPIKIPA